VLFRSPEIAITAKNAFSQTNPEEESIWKSALSNETTFSYNPADNLLFAEVKIIYSKNRFDKILMKIGLESEIVTSFEMGSTTRVTTGYGEDALMAAAVAKCTRLSKKK
jgi:hypothetical protein